ncbi:metallophosphoesterase family protein [Methanobacterium petrolearium]|uniref:metallophosphoesterase family protein n=1 Tax=Methanobacterium petrolearium TaxID=710190 RepID=UPI001AE26879|nr:metallophosphoesterase [Methanobacterium petrolearium]MBP1945326.1 3',5'-cyclic AMP phosphodiesterase CpdA [Methanobacterium petrolearium]BDZ71508.1 transcriptional regulator [Methanobacterium petrolearium]
MVLIAHISDFHIGSISFQEQLLLQSIDTINDMAPDVTIITGDLTENGYYMEMEKAAGYIENIKSPLMVVPGNHDARHVGDQCFRELIRDRYGTLQVLNGLKSGLKIMGLDSSEPDLNYGKVGRAQQAWMEEQLDDATQNGMYKIIALHHHIIPVPRTGRERNVLSDAGDILYSIISKNADLVLSGHKHVPHVWMVQNTAFATAGTVSSLKLRGKDPASFNTVIIDDDYIEILLNSADGKTNCLAKYENRCR